MSFSDDCARFEVHAAGMTGAVLQRSALEVFNSVRVRSFVTGSLGTPVDTGYAQSTWRVEHGDTPATGGGPVPFADGYTTLEAMQPGDVVSIIGGAVYLRGLEEGRAKRVPAGWVRLTAAAWPRIVEWATTAVRGGA